MMSATRASSSAEPLAAMAWVETRPTPTFWRRGSATRLRGQPADQRPSRTLRRLQGGDVLRAGVATHAPAVQAEDE